MVRYGHRTTRYAHCVATVPTCTGQPDPVGYQFQKFDAMADAHYTMLAQSTKISLSNHGLFQIFGLEMLCRYWRAGRRTETTLPFIRTHLKKILDLSFTPEGVHMESSPEYHSFVLGTLQRACQGSIFAEEMQHILNKAAQIEPFLTMPDGHFPTFGDGPCQNA